MASSCSHFRRRVSSSVFKLQARSRFNFFSPSFSRLSSMRRDFDRNPVEMSVNKMSFGRAILHKYDETKWSDLRNPLRGQLLPQSYHRPLDHIWVSLVFCPIESEEGFQQFFFYCNTCYSTRQNSCWRTCFLSTQRSLGWSDFSFLGCRGKGRIFYLTGLCSLLSSSPSPGHAAFSI